MHASCVLVNGILHFRKARQNNTIVFVRFALLKSCACVRYTKIMLYSLISLISIAIRYFLCFFTIERFPIFESEAAQTLWSALFGWVIYAVFQGICYPLVGTISRKYQIHSSAFRSLLYFLLYIPLVLIAWVVLLLLTRFHVLPIQSALTQNFWAGLGAKIGLFFQLLTDLISHVID